MADNKRKPARPSTPDQILKLKEWMEVATTNSCPSPSAEELEKVPQLLAFLCPELIYDPDHRGEAKPKKVFREPLLMVSWDRATGRWKWAITDKICRVSVGSHFDSLIGFSEQIERALAEKKCFVKELEVTRRKLDDFVP